MDDPILTPAPGRDCLYPLRYPDLWKLYKDASSGVWFAEEIDLSHDTKDWEKLTDDERRFLTRVLGYFSSVDALVCENLATRFIDDVQIPEARAFWNYQMFNEQVHHETYQLLIEHFVKDPDEKHEILHAAETIPAIRRKADWANRWIGSNDSFAERLVAFATIEGIQFSASFAAIFWVKKRGLLPGLCLSNSYIARDEGTHRDFACALYKHLRGRLSDDMVHTIVHEAVDAELAFVDDALPVTVIGLNADDLKGYVRFVADRLLESLGHPMLYGAKCTLSFMEQISLRSKANFFEGRVTEYSKAGVATRAERVFKVDEDF